MTIFNVTSSFISLYLYFVVNRKFIHTRLLSAGMNKSPGRIDRFQPIEPHTLPLSPTKTDEEKHIQMKDLKDIGSLKIVFLLSSTMNNKFFDQESRSESSRHSGTRSRCPQMCPRSLPDPGCTDPRLRARRSDVDALPYPPDEQGVRLPKQTPTEHECPPPNSSGQKVSSRVASD